MFITILTPTYNRKHTLNNLYQSLEMQSCKDFEWLIVDDGSSDDTEDYISKIKKTASFNIKYIYKKNGGKHTAINTGVNSIDTPLTFIVDSDDYLTSEAIEIIYSVWETIKSTPKIGSIWFLQSDANDNLIGNAFPTDRYISNYVNVMVNSGLKGDKKSVYLTKLRKEFPFPEFAGEKFIGESTVHKKIATKYDSIFINKVIYKGDYLEDGLSRAGRKMRMENPLGGMENSKVFFTKDVSVYVKTKKMILYLIYGFVANLSFSKIIKYSGKPAIALFLSPISFILFLRWKK